MKKKYPNYILLSTPTTFSGSEFYTLTTNNTSTYVYNINWARNEYIQDVPKEEEGIFDDEAYEEV